MRAHALQRSAGNRSVSALLAREPEPQADEKTKVTAGPGGLATLSEIGAIPLQSVSMPGSPLPGTGGGGNMRKPPVTTQLSFTSTTGDHSAKLFRALSDGTSMSVDVLMSAGPHLTITGAVISSYQVSGSGDAPAESWSLVYDKLTWA